MGLWKPGIGVPNLIHIRTFQVDGRGEEGRGVWPEILREIGHLYGLKAPETGDAEFMLGSSEAYLKVFDGDNLLTVLIALKPREEGKCATSLHFQRVEAAYDDDALLLMELLPKDPLYSFTLRVGWRKSLGEAKSLIYGYVDGRGSSIRSMGIVGGCVLSILGSLQLPDPFKRESLLVPYDPIPERAASDLWRLTKSMVLLASCAGRLSQIRSGRELMLSQVDASEESTQLRIDEVLMELRKPTEQLRPRDLEEILREVRTY